jgi:hypothetical protein
MMFTRARDRQDEAIRKPELKLVVPDVLKVILVDDWEAVTKNNQVSVAAAYARIALFHVFAVLATCLPCYSPMP